MTGLMLPVNRLLGLVPRGDDATNKHREEQGLPLDQMDAEGVRFRQTTSQQSPAAEDLSEIRTSSGTLPSVTVEETSQVQEDPELEDSFVKINLRRISTTFSPRIRAEKRKTEEKRLNKLHGYHRLEKESYEKVPQGFPRLAAFVSSDDDLQISRGYKTLHNHLILICEVELNELEKRLAELDKHDDTDPITNHRLKHTEHKNCWDDKRKILMIDIKAKLKEYDDLVLRHAKMQALGRTPKRVHKVLYNWIWQNKPLAPGYWDFIMHQDDFLSINGHGSNYFETFLQDRLNSWPWSFLKPYLVTATEREKTTDTQVTYYSATLLKIWGGLFLVLTTVGILLTPVFLLFLVPMSRSWMAVTASIFIVLFSIVVSVVTGAHVYNVFVSTATYSAIVVTFLGNISAGNGKVTPPM
ncbi:hypothetical protein ONS95_002755 [Cadophora gregata]|uniref:uncharacterized protein n=1 Tax=Cadophora gregata TaxID=51156 RepID=UPI0026DBC6A0|nr:uncharacterized protein ONS95_002755 [Cadophora gregata]KAK0110099.1 hypothetical protein ONS95_002755 [Cadophora gregata]KAK0110282.1 hypothetical protein ONS96_001901 [Cadophora gregata f. sp. sojae]